MKSRLTRIVWVAAVAEIAYLSLVNLVLNLPSTQSLLNQYRPKIYAVSWDRAWSWHPFRVHARGISVNGQTPSHQWQADASAVSGSVAVWPLLRRTVNVHDVDVQDVVFRLRPRPEPGTEPVPVRASLPPVRGRDPDSPAVARVPRSGEGGWLFVANGLRARGGHDIWVHQVRGLLQGRLRADVVFETGSGRLSLSGGEADVQLTTLTVDRGRQVSSGGRLKGRFDVAPFAFPEHPGIKALGFLTADADIDLAVESLGFLDAYLLDYEGVAVDARGRLTGHLEYARGSLTAGTALAVSADRLALTAVPYQVEGDGVIDIAVESEAARPLGIGILFGELRAFHREEQTPLFTGTGLEVKARGDLHIPTDGGRGIRVDRLALTLPSVRVPDLRLYQRYLPDKWQVRLMGGNGLLRLRGEYSESGLNAALNLASDEALVGVSDYRFQTNLDLGLNLRAGTGESASLDLSGSYLHLDEARLGSGAKGGSVPWGASLDIVQGTLGIPAPQRMDRVPGPGRLLPGFRENGLQAILGTADADLVADLRVSDLEWLSLLFANPFELAVSGAGEATADLRVRDGWFARGSTLTMQRPEMRVQVLDYVARGDGFVTLEFKEGGPSPDIGFEARLSGAGLRRRGEERAVVQDVDLELSAVARDVSFRGGEVAALDLRIPSARVTDVSAYNQYLPDGAPLRLLGGEADLTADVHLEAGTAGGRVKLETNRLRTRLDEQEVAGEVTLDVELRDGVPMDMDFDISGSSLSLRGFTVTGDQQSFDGSDWSGRVGLRKGRVVWKKPLRLDAEAEIEMVDSRPILAIFANQRGRHRWLEKMLTVKDLRGIATMRVAADRALVPYALVGSDGIDVGVKGLVDPDGREGIFYARFHKLHGILKTRDGKHDFDIFGAKRKFEAYVPGQTPLGLSNVDSR